jgi:hypothetical protein
MSAPGEPPRELAGVVGGHEVGVEHFQRLKKTRDKGRGHTHFRTWVPHVC